MKIFILLLFLCGFYYLSEAQNIGIGTTTPDLSAKIDISSTSKGFLPPRLTFLQRNTIAAPAVGLVIYCLDCNEMQVFNGFMWTNLNGISASVKSGPGMRICNEVWMYKNLNVRTYRNGDSIPVITDPIAWANLTTGAMCWYNNDSVSYGANYGILYNWYAVHDPRGLAPVGWHLPTAAEWTVLTNCLGGENIAGGKMKSATSLWTPPNFAATNSSGFGGLPGGARYGNGAYSDISNYGYWWSTTESGAGNAWYRSLLFSSGNVINLNNNKAYGYSVRCVRDW